MTLVEELKKYREEKDISIRCMAEEIGIGRTALSLYLSGSYNSNPMKIENKIIAYLKDIEEELETDELENQQEIENQMAKIINEDIEMIDKNIGNKEEQNKELEPVDKEFFKSEDVKMMIGLLKACQDENLLGCITGQSGYGKTLTLRRYASLDKVIYIECDCMMNCTDLIYSIERGIGLPRGKGTNSRRADDIKEFFRNNDGYLMILDEADKLINRDTIAKLEVLRSIFDQSTTDNFAQYSNLGIVVVGESKLKKDIVNYDKRFANRISQYYELKGLTREEVITYLSGIDITKSAMEELIYRATNGFNGCFRTLNRTMRNIKSAFGDTKITVDVITKSSSMML